MTVDSPAKADNQTLPVRRRNPLLWGLSLLIALLIVGYMLSLIDVSLLLTMMGQLSLPTIVAAFSVYVLLNGFRAIRFKILLGDVKLSLFRLTAIALVHNFLVRLLPFKSGEIAYFVLLRDYPGFTVQNGVTSLFGSRLLELLVILLVAISSLLLAGDLFADQRLVAIVLAGVILIPGVISLYHAGTILRWINALLKRVPLSILNPVIVKLDHIATDVDRLKHPGLFTRALFMSFFTYGCSFSVNWILLAGLSIQIDYITLVVVISLGMFATAVPFNISGFGVVELSWAFGLTTLLSFDVTTATSIGLLLNGFQLLSAAVSGLAGYLVLSLSVTS